MLTKPPLTLSPTADISPSLLGFRIERCIGISIPAHIQICGVARIFPPCLPAGQSSVCNPIAPAMCWQLSRLLIKITIAEG